MHEGRHTVAHDAVLFGDVKVVVRSPFDVKLDEVRVVRVLGGGTDEIRKRPELGGERRLGGMLAHRDAVDGDGEGESVDVFAGGSGKVVEREDGFHSVREASLGGADALEPG